MRRVGLAIHNDGPRIVSTTYWATPHAQAGYLYLSVNAGAVRLLVPDATRYLFDELPPVGTAGELLRVARPGGREIYRLLWHDRPGDPYGVEIDVRQADRRLPASDRGREVPLVWYTSAPDAGPTAVREVRRETIRIA